MDFKEEGNKCFQKRHYSDAIQYYTKAITKNSEIATFFTNRALCYLKLKNWEKAIFDCKTALELDSNLVKGYFFYGQALLEMKMFDEAINSLVKAHSLAKDQKLHFGDDIASTIRLAKKKRFNWLEDKRIEEEIYLLNYLTSLIEADGQRQISLIEENSAEKDDEKLEKIDIVKKKMAQHLDETNRLFFEVDDRRRKREVPDYLCGKISFEIMRDPVITPSGITYERKDITEHLQRVGHFDPVTRTDLVQEQLIPNLALKDVSDHFLELNPWAEDY